MKEIIQIDNWNIFQLLNENQESEMWEFLEKIQGSIVNVLIEINNKYPEITLGIEIKTNNNNEIIKFN